MPTFLVEVYAPRSARLADLEAAARACTRARPVEHVESIHVPEDETCFHVFRGPSAESVREAAAHGALTVQRIVRADRRHSPGRRAAVSDENAGRGG